MDARIWAFFALFLLLPLGGWVYRKWRKRSTLAHAAHVLEDAFIDADRGIVTGTIDGRTVRAELTSRGDGSSSTSWTEVTVEVSMTVDVALRPQTFAERLDLERGLSVDVIVGDRAFDEAFIVEGAPADTVREVFADAALRRTLVRLGKVELTQRGGKLMLARKGWLWGEDLAEMTRAAGTLASRMAALPTARIMDADMAPLVQARATRARKWRARNILIAAIFVTVVLVTVLVQIFAGH